MCAVSVVASVNRNIFTFHLMSMRDAPEVRSVYLVSCGFLALMFRMHIVNKFGKFIVQFIKQFNPFYCLVHLKAVNNTHTRLRIVYEKWFVLQLL